MAPVRRRLRENAWVRSVDEKRALDKVGALVAQQARYLSEGGRRARPGVQTFGRLHEEWGNEGRWPSGQRLRKVRVGSQTELRACRRVLHGAVLQRYKSVLGYQR